MIVTDGGISSLSLPPFAQWAILIILLCGFSALGIYIVQRDFVMREVNDYREQIIALDSRNKILSSTLEEMEGIVNISLNYLDQIDKISEQKDSKVPELISRVASIDKKRIEIDIADSASVLYVKKISDDVNEKISTLETIINLFKPKFIDENKAAGGIFIPQASAHNITNTYNMRKDIEARINKLVELNKVVNNLPVGTPLLGSTISSRFGRRTDPFLKTPAIHNGVDLVAPQRSLIRSTGGGKIAYAGNMGSYGLAVVVDHGNKIKTLYAHMSKVMVEKGQKVSKGDVLGRIGSTGRSSGTHLHYEVNIEGRVVNPERFMYIKTHGIK